LTSLPPFWDVFAASSEPFKEAAAGILQVDCAADAAEARAATAEGH